MKRKMLMILIIALVVITGAIAYHIMQSKTVVTHSGHDNMDGMNMIKENDTQEMEGMSMKEKDKSMDGMNMGDGSDNTGADIPHDLALHTLMQPTNSYVITSIPVTGLTHSSQNAAVEVLGFTAYNTSTIGSVAARITGRIEKLYVQYRFQKINKGQKIMEIYSPEFLTAQQNLLFLLKSDGGNASLIEAAKQRLLLLGFPPNEMEQIIKTGKPLFTVTVYSSYSGHIHETSESEMSNEQVGSGAMDASQPQQLTTQELTVKEGMYVQKGQSVFLVYDPDKLWALLNIYPSEFPFVKVGETALIKPEGYPNKNFKGTIYFVEPFFRPGSRTITARVNIPNQQLKLPIGTQVRATLLNISYKGSWLPRESVLSLGVDKVVFMKVKGGFKAKKIETGVLTGKMIQVLGGINPTDSVAANAQYLVDSESFIKINQ
jgi:Cu(I)/Ag(I) efflux system membrane fusion protein